jgi:hypothetical protein
MCFIINNKKIFPIDLTRVFCLLFLLKHEPGRRGQDDHGEEERDSLRVQSPREAARVCGQGGDQYGSDQGKRPLLPEGHIHNHRPGRQVLHQSPF